MGGDGMDSSTLVEIAGDAVKNVYYTSVAADASKTPEGQDFSSKYKEKYNKNVESYSAYGYDSMSVLLKGLEAAIKGNDGKLPSREKVTEEVRKVQDFQGVVTKVGFDDKGDNKYAKVYIYKFSEPKYPGVQDGEISK
jgi:branched-chain amino acid transport system substrate-binding protein